MSKNPAERPWEEALTLPVSHWGAGSRNTPGKMAAGNGCAPPRVVGDSQRCKVAGGSRSQCNRFGTRGSLLKWDI